MSETDIASAAAVPTNYVGLVFHVSCIVRMAIEYLTSSFHYGFPDARSLCSRSQTYLAYLILYLSFLYPWLRITPAVIRVFKYEI